MKLSTTVRFGLTLLAAILTPSMLGAQGSAVPPVLGTPVTTAPSGALHSADPGNERPGADSSRGDGAVQEDSLPTASDATAAPGAEAAESGLLGVASAREYMEETSSGEPAHAPADREARIARLFGHSGSLRAAIVQLEGVAEIEALTAAPSAGWVPIYGDGPELLGEPVRVEGLPSPAGPGIYMLEDASDGFTAGTGLPLAVITTAPFDLKRNGYLNGYHIGRYPAEGSDRTDRYAPPAGFIEVTPENQDFQISEHFRLRQFLTKDQHDVWPKYLALDLRLIDKLELVLQELNAMGVRADAMHVMSGFRTPQYNGPGGDGRATLSRHTYGDAADVWVDNDGDGYMDDLNGDGRADIQDARVMMRAVERVERRYPQLVGGAGVYVANSAHGPFIHIDVRGSRARW